MGFNQIGFKGNTEPQPYVDASQNSGQQYIVRSRGVLPITLAPGQSMIVPIGQWRAIPGRYSTVQFYDQATQRWRNFPGQQAGAPTVISSDGTDVRIANTTGTPVSAVITNVGNGNATNGFNTVTVTPSAGNSTWRTLVGGSVNTTVNVNANLNAGNYSLAPLIVWQPAGNQTLPFMPPEFICNLSANGNINTVTCINGGAGLTAPGTLTFIQQPGDTNPGGANLVLNANLTNSGNLTALWPVAQGTGLTAVPTLTFSVGGSMAATVLMDFTVTGILNTTNVGANYGASQAVTIISANGVSNIVANANSALTTNYDTEIVPPRMAWISACSVANGQVNNGNQVYIVDGGKNLQAVPVLTVIPGNQTGANISQAVFTAAVGGVNDSSYLVGI